MHHKKDHEDVAAEQLVKKLPAPPPNKTMPITKKAPSEAPLGKTMPNGTTWTPPVKAVPSAKKMPPAIPDDDEPEVPEVPEPSPEPDDDDEAPTPASKTLPNGKTWTPTVKTLPSGKTWPPTVKTWPPTGKTVPGGQLRQAATQGEEWSFWNAPDCARLL